MKIKKFAQLFEGATEDYDKIVSAVQRTKIPCKVRLTEFSGRTTVEILFGYNYPDRLIDKIQDELDKDKITTVPDFAADSDGAKIIKSISLSGGPKRY